MPRSTRLSNSSSGAASSDVLPAAGETGDGAWVCRAESTSVRHDLVNWRRCGLTPDIAGLPPRCGKLRGISRGREPAAFNARVIAQWYDDAGQATGQPAMLLSDRGAFFSHIILRDDLDKKKQMLAAVLGQLDPALWKEMANNALAASGRVGHLEDYAGLVEFLKSSNDQQVASSGRSREIAVAAGKKQKTERYAEVVRLAGAVHEQLVQAYVRAQPEQVEGRACWNHSGTGAYDGDWDRTAKELTENGFNMVLPNMLWGGVAHYPSDVLPRSRTFEKYGDQIAQCVAAAKKYGLQVHVWKVNWNLSTAPQEFVEKIRSEHRNQVTVSGEPRTGCVLPTRTISSWNWTACWKWRANTMSTVCTSTTSAIRTATSATARDADPGSNSRPASKSRTGRPIAIPATCGTRMRNGAAIRLRGS